jgi:hypothetical protein
MPEDSTGVLPCFVLGLLVAVLPLASVRFATVGAALGAFFGASVLALRVFLLPPRPTITLLAVAVAIVGTAAGVWVGPRWPSPRRPRLGTATRVALAIGLVALIAGTASVPAEAPAGAFVDPGSRALRFDSLVPVSAVPVSDGSVRTNGNPAYVTCRSLGERVRACVHVVDGTRCVRGPYVQLPLDPVVDPYAHSCPAPPVRRTADGRYVVFPPGEWPGLLVEDPWTVPAPLRVLGIRPPVTWLQMGWTAWLVGAVLVAFAERGASWRRRREAKAGSPVAGAPYRAASDRMDASFSDFRSLRARALVVLVAATGPTVVAIVVRIVAR